MGWGRIEDKKNARCGRGNRAFLVLSGTLQNGAPASLTLGVLRALASLAQAHLLSFYFAGIAGDVTGTAQCTAQGFVVFHQGTGDAVADSAGLTEAAAALNRYVNAEFVI